MTLLKKLTLIVPAIFFMLTIMALANGYRIIETRQFYLNRKSYDVAIIERNYGQKDVLLRQVVKSGALNFPFVLWTFSNIVKDTFTNITVKNIEKYSKYVQIDIVCDRDSDASFVYTVKFNGLLAMITDYKTEYRTRSPKDYGRSYKTENRDKPDSVFQKIIKAMDYTNPTTRGFAIKLARQYPGTYNAAQVCAIYEHLKKKWAYINDPSGLELIVPASESIEVGLAGDCDDFAVLMASLIQAIGGKARVIVAQGVKGCHAYAEVYIGSNEFEAKKSIDNIMKAHSYRNILSDFFNFLMTGNIYKNVNWHSGVDGCWLNLDWTAKYPGGPFFEAYKETATYPDGRIINVKIGR